MIEKRSKKRKATAGVASSNSMPCGEETSGPDFSDSASKPSQNVDTLTPVKRIKVSSLVRPKSCPPVIASMSGFEIDQNVVFRTYQAKSDAKAKNKQDIPAVDRKIMLQSEMHGNIYYRAWEDHMQPGLNHFIGIYDPQTDEMEVIQAKKMIMRCIIKEKEPTAEMGEKEELSKEERNKQLIREFGSLKARKRLEAREAFAITEDQFQSAEALDASRMTNEIARENVSKMATREQLQIIVNKAKPLPPLNIKATEVQDTYIPEILIGDKFYDMVPISDWQDTVRKGEGVQTVSRYVASRVNALAKDEASENRLRVLRYMSFLIDLDRSAKPGPRGIRFIPQVSKLREVLKSAPEELVEGMRSKFSDLGEMRKFHTDLVITHLCAFACIVDNFTVNTKDLRHDLTLNDKELCSYFREIGASVKHRKASTIITLQLPLKFPKQQRFIPRKK